MDHAAPGTAAWSHAMAGLTARRAPARATGAGARQYTLGAGRVRGPVGVAASRTGSPRRRGRVETHVARFLDLYLSISADDTQENYAYAFHERTLITASAFPSKQPNRHRKRVTTHTSDV